MRPVYKGNAPQAYAIHSDAQPDLAAAIGRFCSYCGRFVTEGIHVEHKRPQVHYPAEALMWSNFLLACGNCNGSKGHRRMQLSSYFWPDMDNTMRAFEYLPGGIIRKARALPKRLRRKATRTIRLLGLDKMPGAHYPPTDRDHRWRDRRTQWDKAMLFRDQLREYDTPGQREAAIAAAADGIFSIWWTVFAGDMDMRRRLRRAFPGTHIGCFDANEDLLPRVGGQV